MTEGEIVMRGIKSVRIIEEISQKYNLSLEKAMDVYYTSDTAKLIEEKIADLHCRSAGYLAQCVWDEKHEDALVAR